MGFNKFHDHCLYDIPCFCVYSAKGSEYHAHEDFYEFIFVTRGSFCNVMNNNTTICESDLLLFFQAGESHEFLVNEIDSAHYAFIIKRDFFEDYFRKFCTLHNIVHELSGIPSFSTKKLSGFQMTYLSQIAITIAYATSFNYISIATHLLDTLLFILLIDMPANECLDIHGYAVDLQKRLDNYHSLDQNLSVLYSNYPISPYTISNQFKKLTGYTVVEYRNIKRMEYAAHLLANENLSVASIANQMNISNLSYFAKQFKMQFGMSPKQYQLLKRKKQ